MKRLMLHYNISPQFPYLDFVVLVFIYTISMFMCLCEIFANRWMFCKKLKIELNEKQIAVLINCIHNVHYVRDCSHKKNRGPTRTNMDQSKCGLCICNCVQYRHTHTLKYMCLIIQKRKSGSLLHFFCLFVLLSTNTFLFLSFFSLLIDK